MDAQQETRQEKSERRRVSRDQITLRGLDKAHSFRHLAFGAERDYGHDLIFAHLTLTVCQHNPIARVFSTSNLLNQLLAIMPSHQEQPRQLASLQ